MFLSLSEEISDNAWKLSGQLSGIVLTTIIISTLCIVYNVKIRGHKEGEKLSGFLVLVEMFITSVENLVVSIMGKKYRKLTPYAMYIMLYIIIGSLLSMLGIEAPATSYTVTLSMGFVTFITIYYFGFKYQKLAYFKRFKNPIELFTQFTPLLSISFRLFGNLLGGSIILGLLYAMFIGMQASWSGGGTAVEGHSWPNWDMWNMDAGEDAWKAQYIYWWSGINIFTTVITPFLHMYFDIFDAVVQSIVFVMLTMSYWAEAMGDQSEIEDVQETSRSRSQREVKFVELKTKVKNRRAQRA
ncbi:F0F1 ATP synthase subunit A [[Acholeplasma] multilocale]|uniref:F0F1 ATP synthase subunit A n=1 Tax=[Acholeplasma] multilocale TaxID=264638 RepID=UPI000685FD72|nr:F0F1 ATP synthase subunit A [[Acholeplasma] multilocale]